MGVVKNKITSSVSNLLVWVFSLSFIYPILYMISFSLKSKKEYYKNPVSLLVQNITIENYEMVFLRINVLRGVFNSLFIAFTSVFLILLFAHIDANFFRIMVELYSRFFICWNSPSKNR